jgi:ubiquinone/menaquinone biosynthesis C-methylase UbiE
MNRQEHYRQEYRRIRPGWQDSQARYRAHVSALVGEATRVLDLGCGSAGCLREIYARTPHVYGLDLDLAALHRNATIAGRAAGAGESLPFADGSFDLVTLAWVLEHLDEPQQVLRELQRVLRPGGRVVFLTPNAWNYNVWLIRAVPNWLHPAFTRALYDRRDRETYPVRYRANTLRRIDAAMREAGLRMQHCELNGDPSYISFTPQLFRLACAIEALLDRPALRQARVHLIGVYQKPVVDEGQETRDRRQETRDWPWSA